MNRNQLLIDLNVVLSEQGDGFARAGRSIVIQRSFPDRQLQILEERYPQVVTRARFQALHATVLESWNADPVTVGQNFRAALIDAFTRLGRFSQSGLIEIDGENAGPHWPRNVAHNGQLNERRQRETGA